MRLLVEFSHPAQVHKFKNTLRILRDDGASILILSRHKDVMVNLLDSLDLPHICISRAASGWAGLAGELFIRELRTLYYAIRFRPTLILAAHSVSAVHVGWVLRIPTVVHEDTEFGVLQQKLYMPFARFVITSTSYEKDWGDKQIRVNSLEPLAYLHPNRFTPDPSVLEKYDLSEDEPFAIVRFISWSAAHDSGHTGLSKDQRRALIRTLRDIGSRRVVVSSEAPDCLGELEGVVATRPEDFHDVLAFAHICVSEGITVANEAAVLGIPTLLLNPLRAGHSLELERYGLLQRISSWESLCSRCHSLWRSPDTRTQCKMRLSRLLADKTDMTTDFVKLLRELGQAKANE